MNIWPILYTGTVAYAGHFSPSLPTIYGNAPRWTTSGWLSRIASIWWICLKNKVFNTFYTVLKVTVYITWPPTCSTITIPSNTPLYILYDCCIKPFIPSTVKQETKVVHLKKIAWWRFCFSSWESCELYDRSH